MKKIFLAFLFVVLGAPAAQAGFMIEPFIGYEMGTSKMSGQEDGDYTGTTMGARLGYGVLGFSFGAEYAMNSGSAEDDDGESDVDSTTLGAFVSYEFPIMLRVYATYMLDVTSEIEGNDEDFTGSGMKFGVGYTGLPFLVINLEMSNITLDEYDGQSFNNEIDLNTYALVLSLPLP